MSYLTSMTSYFSLHIQYIQQLIRYMTFHELKEKSMMIDFTKRFRQVDGAKIGRTTTFDVIVNNITDCADSKATTIAFFETKLIICS